MCTVGEDLIGGECMRIVIAGGSGQMGRMLARRFHASGHDVVVLSRRPSTEPWAVVRWDARTEGEWVLTLEGADVLINLAGRSVNCRYTPENQREIYDSRIGPTRLLHGVLGRLPKPPALWMNASTATIYRHSFDRDMDEQTGEFGGAEPDAPRKWDYSVKVARDWEAACLEGRMPATRRLVLRTSILLNPDRGSVFEVLSRLVRLGLGGSNGTGRQYVSWLHEEDFLRAIEFLMAESTLEGPVNLAAPFPLPNREFMRALRKAWGVPFGLPAPALLLGAASFFLRTEPELVLKSRRVVPGRLQGAGFHFQYPHWEQAADDLVSRWKRGTAAD
jgi:uncharacterized protein (TIGR01777 family)